MTTTRHAQAIRTRLRKLRAGNLLRVRHALHSPQGATIRVGQQQYVNFSSNDYLGLANDPRLVRVLRAAVGRYGVGSGASPLVCGRSRAHEQLEQAVAEHLQRARALVFSSGYLANLAVISSFAPGRDDLIVMDKANHASLVDGARVSCARLRRYRHTDPDGLKKLCARGRVLVATDSVFSMDGALADLPGIAARCASSGSLLAVDDAHGFGVLGAGGRGATELFGLDERSVPALMATFGKACGVMGAFVAGPEEIIETIIQTGRTYMYSTAMPPALAVAARLALRLVARASWRREKLRALVDRFVHGAAQLDLPLLASRTPIQAFLTGSATSAVKAGEYARRAGFWVIPIRTPTVPAHTERLRITLNAGHSEEQVDRLLEILDRINRRMLL